jgi:hypothetical protein
MPECSGAGEAARPMGQKRQVFAEYDHYESATLAGSEPRMYARGVKIELQIWNESSWGLTESYIRVLSSQTRSCCRTVFLVVKRNGVVTSNETQKVDWCIS